MPIPPLRPKDASWRAPWPLNWARHLLWAPTIPWSFSLQPWTLWAVTEGLPPSLDNETHKRRAHTGLGLSHPHLRVRQGQAQRRRILSVLSGPAEPQERKNPRARSLPQGRIIKSTGTICLEKGGQQKSSQPSASPEGLPARRGAGAATRTRPEPVRGSYRSGCDSQERLLMTKTSPKQNMLSSSSLAGRTETR